MNILGAIVAGIAGTLVMTMVMVMAPKMGMPKMDIVGMLGSMFSSEGNRSLGMVMHLMMGVVFAVIYALLWNAGIGTVNLVWGAVFGAGHWLIAGVMMGGMAMRNRAGSEWRHAGERPRQNRPSAGQLACICFITGRDFFAKQRINTRQPA